MTDTSMIDQVEERASHDVEHEDHHTSDLLYIQIAIGLAILTAMEVAWPFIVDDGPILIVPLLILMVIKFGIIAAFFMHLRFDNKLLTRIFYAGLFLAVAVYVAALMTFRIFGN
jgi:cytochrome c oxidase subunit 4